MVAYRPEAGKIAIMCIDVSESKFAQARASRVSQMYAALSRCNQAIVRCSTREELFADICRAAVEAGGMKGFDRACGQPDRQGKPHKPVWAQCR